MLLFDRHDALEIAERIARIAGSSFRIATTVSRLGAQPSRQWFDRCHSALRGASRPRRRRPRSPHRAFLLFATVRAAQPGDAPTQ
jgi:hypothetical protein